jgi:hypothetical protein
MKQSKVKKVKEEMNRLSSAIKKLETSGVKFGIDGYWSPKETGAVRRASMDLTRALSELRKSN